MNAKNSNGTAVTAVKRPAVCTPVKPSSQRLLCRFYFHSGHCRNGGACRFSHEANGMTREEALKTIPCPYFAQGACRYGEYCELKHDDAIKDAVCGICLEHVPSMKRSFGVLSCCLHTFCYGCLMEWRTEGSKEVTSRRVCPTCRKSSDFVVPSLVMPTNVEERDQILQKYKIKLSTIPCENFKNFELGSCPFGSDCFYAHLDRKGKDMKPRDKTMNQLYAERQRQRNNRGRDIEYITDMILMMGLRRHLNRQERGGRNRRGRGYVSDESDNEEEEDAFLLSPYMEFITSLIEDDDDLEELLNS